MIPGLLLTPMRAHGHRGHPLVLTTSMWNVFPPQVSTDSPLHTHRLENLEVPTPLWGKGVAGEDWTMHLSGLEKVREGGRTLAGGHRP